MIVRLEPHHFRAPQCSGAFRTAAFAAALLLSLGVAGCKKEEPASDTPVVNVEAARPTVGPLSEQIEGDAILAPLAQAALSPRISAPVKRFDVQLGQHVQAGQVLVELEDQDLQAVELDNRGVYTTAQAAYKETTEAQVPQETQKAELDLEQATATLRLSQSIVDSRRQLFQQGAIPGRDLDTAKATLGQAQVAYDAAARHLQAVNNVSRAATVQSAQGQLTSAKGKYMNAEAGVSYATLRSPIAGVVTQRSLFAGETVAAGTPLVTVMDTSVLIAKVHLAQRLSQQMKVGDTAEIKIPGVQQSFPAQVALISPVLDPGSTTVEVWLRLKNTDGSLKVGTPVKIQVTGHVVANALQVPMSALQPGTDGSVSVMVVGNDGNAHRHVVHVGMESGAKAQIISGIGPSDLVILTGAYGLDDGTQVKLNPSGNTGSSAIEKSGR
jgi:HlyD family secretion protein